MWYVLQVDTGKELEVRDSLTGAGFVSAVPREDRAIYRGGKWTSKEYTLFPSYVFIELAYTADTYYKVTAIPFVQKFLCAGKAPSPLSYLEAEWIKALSCGGAAIAPIMMRADSDGKLCVISGIPLFFKSRLLAVNKHKRRAKFEMMICGVPMTAELSIEII